MCTVSHCVIAVGDSIEERCGRIKSQRFIYHLMQILHIMDRFVRYTICIANCLENLLSHAFLHFWMLSQLIKNASHGSNAGLATGYEEDRRLCEKSIPLES